MDLMLFLQAILALGFVIGLMLVVFWLMKYCEVRGCKNPFLKKLNLPARLVVVESKRLDTKNTLVIARCDRDEYVLLLGSSQNILLQTKKMDNNV